ncbi:ArnT family glycosyltransferase [Hydrogenimonas sp.]
MTNIEKREKKLLWLIAALAALFVGILILLIYTRAAWIDESWFAAYAVHFIRTGEIADLNMARFTDDLPHTYFFYFYTLLQAPFYYLAGESLLVGRLITLASAILGAGAIYINFRRYLELQKIPALLSTLAVVYTYYYIYSATQIRPDLIAVVFVLTGMIFLKNWMEKRGTLWLTLTHLMFILAILLHLQAGFAWVGLWVFLLVNRLGVESKLKTIGLSLPVYIAIALLFVFNEHFESNMHYYYETFFGTGNMAGHKGGMIGSMITKFENGEYLKLAIRIGLLAMLVFNFLYYVHLKKIGVFLNDAFFLVAGASFGSWLLTTTSIDDYHAVWLTMPFMIMAYNMALGSRFTRYLNALFFALLILPSFLYTFKTVKSAPLQQQKLQIQKLNRVYDLPRKNLFIDRDLMWFYSFGENVTYRLKDPTAMPEYLLFRRAAHPKKQSTQFDGKEYKLIDETPLFLLYREEK